MTLIYFVAVVAALIVGYLGYAFVQAYVLTKPTWPFKKTK